MDVLVGAIMCRLERESGGANLYIASLCVLAPYRGKGIGSKLLLDALREASKDPNVGTAYLHMQAGNDEAKEMYKRHGFRHTHTIENFYSGRLDPPHADVFERDLADFRAQGS